MKKILFVLCFVCALVALSCDYDDSNDIDILRPVDSTATGTNVPEVPN